MDDLKVAARLSRWGAGNFAFNLTFIPTEKFTWKPDPASKSTSEIAGEVIGVMQMCMPVFKGGGFEVSEFPKPANAEEVRSLLIPAAEAYAAALEAAGPELERLTMTPGGELWASRAVLFPLIDLIHHHGQICYIQSLLGDAETHFDPAGMAAFGPD